MALDLWVNLITLRSHLHRFTKRLRELNLTYGSQTICLTLLILAIQYGLPKAYCASFVRASCLSRTVLSHIIGLRIACHLGGTRFYLTRLWAAVFQ